MEKMQNHTKKCSCHETDVESEDSYQYRGFSHGVEVKVVPDEEDSGRIIVRLDVADSLAAYPFWLLRDLKNKRLSQKRLKERLDEYAYLKSAHEVGVTEIPLRR